MVVRALSDVTFDQTTPARSRRRKSPHKTEYRSVQRARFRDVARVNIFGFSYRYTLILLFQTNTRLEYAKKPYR